MGVWFCVPISRPIIVAVLLFVNRSFAIVGEKFYGFSSTEHPGCLRETGIDLGRVGEKTRNRKRSNSKMGESETPTPPPDPAVMQKISLSDRNIRERYYELTRQERQMLWRNMVESIVVRENVVDITWRQG